MTTIDHAAADESNLPPTAPPLVPPVTADAPSAAGAASAAGPTVDAAAVTTTSDAPAIATAPTRARRLRLLGGLRWLLARSIAILVFVAGVALGYQAFLSTQPAPPPIGDPATAGVATPAAVDEFIDALQTNDSAALRAAVPGDPYQLLITEMARWDLKSVTGVKTLSTYDDGPRSATELVLTGTTTQGTSLSINLVVHVDGGKIVSFR